MELLTADWLKKCVNTNPLSKNRIRLVIKLVGQTKLLADKIVDYSYNFTLLIPNMTNKLTIQNYVLKKRV
jgi:hypothetical protein